MTEGDLVKCYKSKVRSAVAFGAGLLVASLLPTRWVLVVSAGALVIVSISCIRR